MFLARIAANAPDFLTFIDQHKQWREPFDVDESQIWRQRMIDIDSA